MNIGSSNLKFNLHSQYETLLRSSRGQATVEYILLIALALLLGMGFMVQFNGGTKEYVEELFGGYSSCLLETGELPNLGFQGGSNICKAPQFKWVPSPKAIGSGGGKNGSSPSSSDNEKTTSERQSPPVASSTNPRNSEGGGRGYGGQASSEMGIKSPKSLNDRPDKVKVKGTEAGGGGASDVFTFESSGEKYARFRIVKINTKIKSKQLRTEKEEEMSRPTSRSVEISDNRSRSRKLKVPPRERKPAQVGDLKMEEFTLGYSIKWFIIIGLLIAVLLFMGQQIMDYMKSKDT